jgi:hypothetical protein
MMRTRDVLVAARAKIADPAHWTKGYWARRANGFTCIPRDPMAVCWCVGGAIEACLGGRLGFDALMEKLEPIATEILGPTQPDGSKRRVTFLNDHLGHAAALDLLDRAIARGIE